MQANIVVHPGKAAPGMPDPQDLDIQVRLSQQHGVRRSGSQPIPGRFFQVRAKNDRCSRLSRALTTDHEEYCRCVFQNTLKAKPDGERNPSNSLLGKIAEVESDSAKPAA